MSVQQGTTILLHPVPIQHMEDYYQLPLPLSDKYINHLRERKIPYISIEKDEHITTYYTMFKVLGKGTFGVVYAARENRNNSVWAIKILTKKDGKILKIFEREIAILKFVDHPYIIRLHCIVESPTSVYLVVDKGDNVLSDLFRMKSVLTESETRGIIKQLASAVTYLHQNGIAHRDIKMENILLINDDSVINESKFTIKLTDFGLSVVRTGACFQEMMRERCGTLAYMAPEIILKKSYSQQCDVWAIGVLLYTLLSGEFPFKRPTENDIKEAILSDEPNFAIIKVEFGNIECVVHLIERLLDKDPANRSTAIEILDHPWIREQPLNQLKSDNVLEMMAKWRDELRQVRPICDSEAFDTQSNTTCISIQEHTSKLGKGQYLITPTPFIQKTRRPTPKTLQKPRRSIISGKTRLPSFSGQSPESGNKVPPPVKHYDTERKLSKGKTEVQSIAVTPPPRRNVIMAGRNQIRVNATPASTSKQDHRRRKSKDSVTAATDNKDRTTAAKKLIGK